MDTLKVERIAFSEARRLWRRDRSTYAKMLAGLYACQFMRGVSAEDARLTRAGYFFARHIDDALDGENSFYKNSSATPEQLPVSIDKLGKSKHPIALLGKRAIEGLEKRRHENDNPYGDMQTLINSMVFDFQRAGEGTFLFENNETMQSYFGATMRGVNMMLIGFHSRLRQDDGLPSLSNGLGVIYSARDRAEDWNRRIYNIPRDNLTNIAQSGSRLIPSYSQLVTNGGFYDWQDRQLTVADYDIQTTLEAVYPLANVDPGARVVKLLGEQALHYIPAIKQSLSRSPNTFTPN